MTKPEMDAKVTAAPAWQPIRRVRLTTALIVLGAGAALVHHGYADPQSPEGGGEGVRRLKELEHVASRHRMAADPTPDDPFDFHPRPLLNWSNPTRPAPYGGTFLWTHRGRPAVVGCIYEWAPGETSILNREFHSLVDFALRAEYNEQLFWSPPAAGVKFALLAQAPAPAKTPRARLNQMKTIARAFSARLVRLEGQTDFELRLLTTPLYRYGADDSETIDGGLFAFVQGTDPEVLLLLEAREAADAAPKWHYALARMTSGALEVRRGDDRVWEIEEIPAARLPDSGRPYAVFFRASPQPARTAGRRAADDGGNSNQ